jgi:hypothetical protein
VRRANSAGCRRIYADPSHVCRPGGGFTVGEAAAPQPRVPGVTLRTLGGIDAIEDPTERRRRGVKHGRRALDAFDEV